MTRPVSPFSQQQKSSGDSPAAASAKPGDKRRVPITFGGQDSANKSKDGRRMYQPPSGKYSDRAGGYREQGGQRGARGGRGRYRGGNRY